MSSATERPEIVVSTSSEAERIGDGNSDVDLLDFIDDEVSERPTGHGSSDNGLTDERRASHSLDRQLRQSGGLRASNISTEPETIASGVGTGAIRRFRGNFLGLDEFSREDTEEDKSNSHDGDNSPLAETGDRTLIARPSSSKNVVLSEHTSPEVSKVSDSTRLSVKAEDGERSSMPRTRANEQWAILVRSGDEEEGTKPQRRASIVSFSDQVSEEPTSEEDSKSKTPLEAKGTEGFKGVVARNRRSTARLSAIIPPANVLGELSSLHERYVEMQTAFNLELATLRTKYDLKLKPIFEKRRTALCNSTNTTNSKTEHPSVGTKLLPGFWLQACLNNAVMAAAIEPADEDVFWYLENVESAWEDTSRADGNFALTFTFSENPYFKERRLSKKFVLGQAVNESGSELLKETMGTPISWKGEAVNLTQSVIYRKQRNRRTKETRTLAEILSKKSFFNFFKSHKLPSTEDVEHFSDEAASEKKRISEEMEIGAVLRDEIIPQALNWYLGICNDSESSHDSDSSGSSEEDDQDSDSDVTGRKPSSAASWFL